VTRYGLYDLVSLPTGGLRMRKIFAWVRLRRVLVLACIWVGVFFLVEVAESVVHLPMLALICTNCIYVSHRHRSWGGRAKLTVKQQVSHCAVTLRHLPVVNRNIRSLKLLPLG
jgi:hypothetical protein